MLSSLAVTPSLATITLGSTTTYTIPNLENGTEYTIQVTATRAGYSNGPASGQKTGTPAPYRQYHRGYEPMADDRKQLEKVMELMGEGSTRRIHLLVIAVLALSGMALQGLVYWYAVRAAGGEWGAVGIQVWAFAVGAWFLTWPWHSCGNA